MTVQLDLTGSQLAGLVGARPGAVERPGEGGPDDKEVPVFVDDSGRRGRTFRRVGVAAGLAIAVYAVVIVATVFSGNSSAPWLPMPAEGKGAGKVGTESTAPTPSASPSLSVSATPEPSASESVVPGVSGVPGVSASPSTDADASGDPSTGASPSGRPTGGDTAPTTKPPKATTSTNPTTDPTDDSTGPATEPGADPSDPADGAGTDTDALAVEGLTDLIVATLVPPLESSVL
ncbi:hypothetical protein ACYBSK_03720 [Streptomyces sp. BYX5S]